MNKLVSINEILADAGKRGYAVGAFNVTDLADIQAVVQTADEERSPVIVQVYNGVSNIISLDYIYAMVETAVRNVIIPVALHLDHGRDLESVKAHIDAGFTSIMIDGSKLPLDENIELARKAVEMAHSAGVSAEAELGVVWSGSQDVSEDDRRKFLTIPDEARRFVDETNVDALAVAIGSAHGLYKFSPKLDFDRLKEIRSVTKANLVLHGGSDIPEDQIRRAVELGISKINVATDLAQAYTKALREVVSNSEGIIWQGTVLKNTREAMKELVRAKIQLFGSSGMA